MPHTNYKQMIEEFDKEFNKYYVGVCIRDKKGQYFFKKDDIKSFLKSQAIKSLNNEIEILEEDKKMLIHMSCAMVGNAVCGECLLQTGRNQALQDHISYLLAQRKLIEDEI